jgi:tetratricopeptide (TPR) repeat protein
MEFRVAQIYNETGSEERTRQYAELCLKSCMELINNPNLRPDLDYSEARGRFAGPYRSAGMLYQMLDEYDKAIDIYRRLIALIESYQLAIQNDPSRAEDLQRMEFNRYDLMTTIDEIEIARIEKEQGIEAAMEAAMKLLTEYEQSDDQTQRMMARYIQETLRDLDRKLNPQDYEDSSNLDMFMQ